MASEDATPPKPRFFGAWQGPGTRGKARGKARAPVARTVARLQTVRGSQVSRSFTERAAGARRDLTRQFAACNTGPFSGDVIAAGGADQRIHLSCAQTGDTIIGCPLSLFGSGDEANSDCPMRGHSKDEECGRASMAREGSRVDARCGSVHRSQTLTV